MTPLFTGKTFVGMVHLLPLPGSPRDRGDIAATLARAVADARALEGGGAHAILVENFHDVPFHKDRVPPHTIAAMTAAVAAVRAGVRVPVGVNVLRNDVRAALAIAHVCGGVFVRCNVYVGAAVTDQGIIEGAALEAVEYRRSLGADVRILADVEVKHAWQLARTPVEQQARDAVERGLADALVVTGSATGAATPIERVRAVKVAVPGTPVLVGSGLGERNAAELLAAADGAIVGSGLHTGGDLLAPIDRERVEAIAAFFGRAGTV